MEKIIRSFLTGFFLLAFLGLLPQGAMAQETDGKIKRLEALEARIDAKLKRLEDLEARLEARLATGLQPVAARSPGVAAASGNGMRGMPLGMPSASVAGAVSGQKMPGLGGQVSFRGGYSHMDSQTGNILSKNGGKGGFVVGGALDIPLLKDPWFNNTLLGQISMDFNGFDAKTSGAVGGNTLAETSIFKIAISPKYRIDSLGNIRPWIIPIGLAFAVNSPPSNGVTYLTVGGTTGAGIEYVLPVFKRHFSLGAKFSYNFFNQGRNQFNSNHISVGPYVGINF